jgi:DnaJ-domain-containing protein 1
MRLSKSRDGEKYVLTFEVSPAEANAGGVNMEQLWKSKSLTEFVAALAKMIKQTTADESFAEKLRKARAAFAGTQQQAYYNQNPFANQFGQDPNQGAYQTRAQMDEEMRRQQAKQQQYYGPFTTSSGRSSKPEWADTLGVPATASKDEIKARYRTLAKENHPDRGGDSAKFAKIHEAYEKAML